MLLLRIRGIRQLFPGNGFAWKTEESLNFSGEIDITIFSILSLTLLLDIV